jgi:hypothetical protein
VGVKAQQDTTKQKEEYALLSATPRFLNANKVNFEMFFGEDKSVSKYSDQEIKDQQENIKKFHSIPDGLNYMAKQGWVFANSYVIVINGAIIYHYIYISKAFFHFKIIRI